MDMPPQINETAVDQNTTVLNTPIQYNISNLFMKHPLLSGPLSYEVTLENGDALPSWIHFDNLASTVNIETDSIQSANITVTASNGRLTKSSQTLEVRIYNTAPVVAHPLSDISWYENISFSQNFDLSNVFEDNDPNHHVSFSVEKWPSFATWSVVLNNLSVSGIADSSFIAQINEVSIKGNDGYDSVIDTFKINVVENYAPIPSSSMISSILWYEDIPCSTTIPAFTDTEGDTITYSMALNNGSSLDSTWMSFSPASRILNLSPNSTTSSPVILKFIAEDEFNIPTEVVITVTIKHRPQDNPSISLSGNYL